MVFDSDHKPTATPTYETDRVISIYTNPKYYGGINNSLKFKQLELDIFFQYTKQIGLNPLLNSSIRPAGFMGFNTIRANLERWQKPSDHSPAQQFTQSFASPAFAAYSIASQSDYGYTDASFIRLKNIAVSYILPAEAVGRLHLQSLKISLRCQNLLTITRYKGIDPESQVSASSLPPLRIMVAALEVTL